MSLDVWDFDLSLSLISVLFFDLLWGLLMDFDLSLSLISMLFFDLLWGLLMDLHGIVWLTDRLFPLPVIANYSRIWQVVLFMK
jgi:hypothetical protein